MAQSCDAAPHSLWALVCPIARQSWDMVSIHCTIGQSSIDRCKQCSVQTETIHAIHPAANHSDIELICDDHICFSAFEAQNWCLVCRLDTHTSMLNNAKAVLSRRIEQMPEEGLLMLLEETFPYVRRHAALHGTAQLACVATASSASKHTQCLWTQRDCRGIKTPLHAHCT